MAREHTYTAFFRSHAGQCVEEVDVRAPNLAEAERLAWAVVREEFEDPGGWGLVFVEKRFHSYF